MLILAFDINEKFKVEFVIQVTFRIVNCQTECSERCFNIDGCYGKYFVERPDQILTQLHYGNEIRLEYNIQVLIAT